MFNSVVRNCKINFVRHYTAKVRRSVLLQDQTKVPDYKPKISDEGKFRVYAWGFQETGALGLQTNIKKATERYTEIVHHPTRMQFSVNTDITDLTAGYGFSAFAVDRSDGQTLYGTGLNTDSQLGYQVHVNSNEVKNVDVLIYPSPIILPRNQDETDEDMKVRCMSGGRAHLVVVTNNGVVFTMGNNAYGQCGREIVENEIYRGSGLIHRIPQAKICGPDDEIIDVECGQDHTMFLTRLGRVYTCGWGADGQTGQGHYKNSGDILMIAGDILNEKIIKLSCASDCVLAVSDKGDCFGWGNSEYGQLDDSENPDTQIHTPRALSVTKNLGKVKDISSGGTFCVALNEEGLVYSWGYGILGFGPYVEQTSKPQHLLPALFGRNDFSDSTEVVAIGSGIFHIGAINSDGDLFMWGKNRFGHLGLGHKKDQYFPFKTAVNGKVEKVVFGVDHTLALCKAFI